MFVYQLLTIDLNYIKAVEENKIFYDRVNAINEFKKMFDENKDCFINEFIWNDMIEDLDNNSSIHFTYEDDYGLIYTIQLIKLNIQSKKIIKN